MGQNFVRRRYRAVFISPHLDDAVFSCAAEIRRLSQEGPVLVLNIFTGYLSSIKNRGRVLNEDRFLEEAAAAKELKFETKNLNELDVSFRRPQYQSLGNIFRPPVARDMEWLPELRKKLFFELEQIEFDNLYLPLGIGWHVDHVLTHLAFDSWPNRNNVWYYEDSPYCLIPHATRLRLNELGSAVRLSSDLTLQPQPFFVAWKETCAAYAKTAMMKNLEPWIVRKLAFPIVSTYFLRLMSFHERLQTKALKIKWDSEIHLLDSNQLNEKVRAMTYYKSQFQEFFLNPAECQKSLSIYAQLSGAEAAGHERFWKPNLN